MKIVCATIVVFLFSFQLAAQDNTVQKMSKIELGLGGLGFSYEAKISKGISVDMSTGISGHYHVDDQSFKYVVAHSNDDLSPSFFISVSPRFYYNLEERVSKGKSIQNNAANYIGVKAKYVSALRSDPGVFLANIHWGMQRNFGPANRWLFNGMVGMGIAAYTKTMYNGGTFYPALDAKIGYRLSK